MRAAGWTYIAAFFGAAAGVLALYALVHRPDPREEMPQQDGNFYDYAPGLSVVMPGWSCTIRGTSQGPERYRVYTMMCQRED